MPGQPLPQQPQQEQPVTPFPPAFKWTAQPPGSERTQTMYPVSGPADATQVVPGTDGRNQAVGPGDADRTQIVHNNPYAQQPYGQQQIQSPWPGPDQSNLYSSDNMPNWNTPGAFGDWPKQGPEVFGSAGSGNGGRRVLLIALVVVVVVGLGVGGWLLFGTKSSAQAGGHSTTPTTTAPPRPRPEPVHPDEPLLTQVPPVVGTINQRGAMLDVSDLVHRQLVDQTVAGLLTQAGVQQVAWRDGSKAPDQYGPTPDYFSVIVIPVSTAAGADSLAAQIRHYQEANGLTYVPPPVPAVPSTIVFEKHTAPSATLYRGLWVCGDDVVWVNVDQQPTTNQVALTTSFQREIVALTQSFPAQ